MLTLEDVGKTYSNDNRSLTVLQEVSFHLQAGQTLSITGASGSGKTTLLGLCAGLDLPSRGRIFIDDICINELSEDDKSLLRNEKVGFIFQNFQLLPTLSSLENVMVPLELRGEPNARKIALELLERVGLKDRANHFPNQLSGGEQQRVAIARAFSNNPKILFADEPTGNLDGATSNLIEELLFSINSEMGTTLVIVTHDPKLAAKTQHKIVLESGKIIEKNWAVFN